MKIENEFIINDCVRCLEIFDDMKEEKTYDYYIVCRGWYLEYAFGVTGEKNSPRMSHDEVLQLWENGYFDYLDTVTEYMQDLTLEHYQKYMGV